MKTISGARLVTRATRALDHFSNLELTFLKLGRFKMTKCQNFVRIIGAAFRNYYFLFKSESQRSLSCFKFTADKDDSRSRYYKLLDSWKMNFVQGSWEYYNNNFQPRNWRARHKNFQSATELWVAC